MLVVDGSRPVATPPPATICEDVHGWVAVVKESRVGAAAVQVGRRGLRLECAAGVDARVEKRIEVANPTVGVLRPLVGSWDASAVERRVLLSSIDNSSPSTGITHETLTVGV